MDGALAGPAFHAPAIFDRVMSAHAGRRSFLEGRWRLPKAQRPIAQLYAARLGGGALADLGATVGGELDPDPLKRQSQLAIAPFHARVASVATLVLDGFDTHVNHERDHLAKTTQLLDGVDHAWRLAEDAGLADRLTMVIGSEFGRIPAFNPCHGKEHGSVTSMILMGRGVPGDRVIGATTDDMHPPAVDPRSLRWMAPEARGGVCLRPCHVHHAIRKIAGVADAPEILDQFPLPGGGDIDLLQA